MNVATVTFFCILVVSTAATVRVEGDPVLGRKCWGRIDEKYPLCPEGYFCVPDIRTDYRGEGKCRIECGGFPRVRCAKGERCDLENYKFMGSLGGCTSGFPS